MTCTVSKNVDTTTTRSQPASEDAVNRQEAEGDGKRCWTRYPDKTHHSNTRPIHALQSKAAEWCAVEVIEARWFLCTSPQNDLRTNAQPVIT
jgi:hypothetical protein